jgi:UDP-N-acetylglucosamine 2-epimerase (non-hydrolysing)
MSVLGARRDIIQMAPLSAALAPLAHEILVHVGPNLGEADGRRTDAGLPRPAYAVDVKSRSRAQQLGIVQLRLARLIERERPDAVLVRGNTNAALSGARAACAACVPLLHVDAGLRSGCADASEERNGVQVDRLAHLLLAPTPAARRTLIEEGLGSEIHVVGDLLFGDYRVALCIARVVRDFIDRQITGSPGVVGRQAIGYRPVHSQRGGDSYLRARRLFPASATAAISPLAKTLLAREWLR